MVSLDDVTLWWLAADGVGHVLLSECTCGECPDPLEALCGEVGAGEKTPAVPSRICPDCRKLLESPSIIAANFVAWSDDPRVQRCAIAAQNRGRPGVPLRRGGLDPLSDKGAGRPAG